MRKFKDQPTAAKALGVHRVREYVDYDAPMPITYRLIEGEGGTWSWDQLLHGWSLRKSAPEDRHEAFEDAYYDLLANVLNGAQQR